MFSADICVVHFTNDHKTLCLQLSFKRRAISTIFVVPWKSVETILLNNYFRYVLELVNGSLPFLGMGPPSRMDILWLFLLLPI